MHIPTSINVLCTHAAPQLLELVAPVQDARGYVYEKDDIINHIDRYGQHGSLECPVAGLWAPLTCMLPA